MSPMSIYMGVTICGFFTHALAQAGAETPAAHSPFGGIRSGLVFLQLGKKGDVIARYSTRAAFAGTSKNSLTPSSWRASKTILDRRERTDTRSTRELETAHSAERCP